MEQKLNANIAHAIRLAKKCHACTVASLLWDALYELNSGHSRPKPISLFSALGLAAGEDADFEVKDPSTVPVHAGDQSEDVVQPEPEAEEMVFANQAGQDFFETMASQLIVAVETQVQAQTRSLVDRIEALERQQAGNTVFSVTDDATELGEADSAPGGMVSAEPRSTQVALKPVSHNRGLSCPRRSDAYLRALERMQAVDDESDDDLSSDTYFE
mmetsp:Transcript_59287/g.138854  ORF Transcript_59287/g.138854 Transcript_59287/m.138854 type:complete len:215 (-) Transcript_59287:100-744(-)